MGPLLLLLLLPAVSTCQSKAFSCSSLPSSTSLRCSCSRATAPSSVHHLSSFSSLPSLPSTAVTSITVTNCTNRETNLRLGLTHLPAVSTFSFSHFLSLTVVLAGVQGSNTTVEVAEVHQLLLRGSATCSPGTSIHLVVAEVVVVELNRLYIPSCTLVITLAGVEEVVVGAVRVGRVVTRGEARRCEVQGRRVPCEGMEGAGGGGGGWRMYGSLGVILGCLVVTVAAIWRRSPATTDTDPAFRRG